MNNEILIQTRTTKKPLPKLDGSFIEVMHIRLSLNGFVLYETNTDIYTLPKQELYEIMLEKSTLLTKALEKTGNKVNIKHGTY